MKKKVYIAGPYSSNPTNNTKVAIEWADILFNDFTPYIPHLCLLWDMVRPHAYEEWLEYDLEWLKACDCVFVVGMSPGVEKEIEIAKDLGILVYYRLEDLVDCEKEYDG